MESNTYHSPYLLEAEAMSGPSLDPCLTWEVTDARSCICIG